MTATPRRDSEVTRRERVFFAFYFVVLCGMPLVAVYLLINDAASKAVGVGLLVATAVLYAVPVSPILRARRRRKTNAT